MQEIRVRNMTSLYLVNDEGILCLYRIGSRIANNKYVGTAGGHFENDEMSDPLKCVLREAKEELGLEENELDNLKLRYITHRLKDDEIRQNYFYFARLKVDKELTSTEGVLNLVPYSDIPMLDMPVSAKHMICHYLEVGRFTDEIYGGITEEAGTKFVAMREF